MIELYSNISNKVKSLAETLWLIATSNSDPIRAAEFLSNAISYYEHILTEEEINFIRFYINIKLEMELDE